MSKLWSRIDRSLGLDDDVYAELVWMLYQSRFGIRWAIIAIDLPLLFLLTHRTEILPHAVVALFFIVCAFRLALSELYARYGDRKQPRRIQRRWDAAYFVVGVSYASILATLTSFVIASDDWQLIAWIIGNIVGYSYGIVAYVANRPAIAYAMTHITLFGAIGAFAASGQSITYWMIANMVIACFAICNMIERHYASTLRAIADRRVVEALARTDYQTGLANRRHLREFFDAMPMPDRLASAFLSIDLDRFKQVNDTFGHAVGDAVLEAAAARIRSSCGRGAFVARIGGDEFAVLIPGGLPAGEDAARSIARAFLQPIVLSGEEVLIGASVGVVAIAATDSLEALGRRADALMYSAKEAAKAA